MNDTVTVKIDAVATKNISMLMGFQTIDGVKTHPNMVVLLPLQHRIADRGVWIVKEGLWIRPRATVYEADKGATHGDTSWIRVQRGRWNQVNHGVSNGVSKP